MRHGKADNGQGLTQTVVGFFWVSKNFKKFIRYKIFFSDLCYFKTQNLLNGVALSVRILQHLQFFNKIN